MSPMRAYLQLCDRQPVWWLQAALRAPTAYQRPIHLKLIAISIRRRGGALKP